MQARLLKLGEARPTVKHFYHAIEGKITRSFYPMKKIGRPTDGIVYVKDGSMLYRFEDKSTLSAKSGDVLFLARGSRYSMENGSEVYTYAVVNFDFDISEDISLKSAVFASQSSRTVENLFNRMLEKWRMQKPAAFEDCMALLYSVYAELLRIESAAYVPASKRARLDAAVQYISESFSSDTLTVTLAAEAAGMSESHFRRLFKSVYNISPVKYIGILRLNRAKELIRYTSATFSQISAETGFASLYYFCRFFKKEVGCTPGEYRDAYRDYQEM